MAGVAVQAVAPDRQSGDVRVSCCRRWKRPLLAEHCERDSSVVRAPDESLLKGRGFESPQKRRESYLLQGQLSVPALSSVSVPLPCYIARKRPRSFCQK